MATPKIIFCEHNHIYDSAIYDECPYCKKISEEQKELNKSIENVKSDNEETELLRPVSNQNDVDDEEEATELLKSEDNEDDDDDEYATELLKTEDEEDDGTEEETELLKVTEPEPETEEPVQEEISVQAILDKCDTVNGCVIGWLVCRNEAQRGRSLELTEEECCLTDSNGVLSVSENKTDDALATLSRSGEHLLVTCKDSIRHSVNGVFSEKDMLIHNYDVITIDKYKFVYVELLKEFADWGK
ncbi:MAG: hypothetical protein IKU52_05660 [Clostridia bacterium]|nr:hypothetical protein [Clostridia bacterium]